MDKECCEDNCCTTSSECCGESQSMSKEMMRLANEAWEDLIKEKMKEAYDKTIGSNMSKTAQVSVEACIKYWEAKMKGQADWAQFEEKLKSS